MVVLIKSVWINRWDVVFRWLCRWGKVGLYLRTARFTCSPDVSGFNNNNNNINNNNNVINFIHTHTRTQKHAHATHAYSHAKRTFSHTHIYTQKHTHTYTPQTHMHIYHARTHTETDRQTDAHTHAPRASNELFSPPKLTWPDGPLMSCWGGLTRLGTLRWASRSLGERVDQSTVNGQSTVSGLLACEW